MRGTREAGRRKQAYNPVHPRVCGEHLLQPLQKLVPRGSSPRMRGTHGRARIRPSHERFIPAYAGNTFAGCQRPRSDTVHPRVCGEHHARMPLPAKRGGSSPRMRGTLRRDPARQPVDRFIPAYAGNTWCATTIWTRWAVHPRVCGEHVDRFLRGIRSRGSSPRMRGTRPACGIDQLRLRFIPAYAGNTSAAASIARHSAVHPRVCGEHNCN